MGVAGLDRPGVLCQNSPRPTLKGIQQVIDSGTIGKIDVKAERLVDMSLVNELEKSGFIESVYKE